MEAAWEIYQRLKHRAKERQLTQQQAQQRPLNKSENAIVQKALRESTLDEGAIGAFVGSAGVAGTAWDIGAHTVIFFGTAEETARSARLVAEECSRLWEWLGVNRPFRLILWWRDAPRRIKATEWPSRLTVNGGWTYQNSSAIFVYRSEEWDRVFLHEMIHALGWDWEMPEKPLACWK